MKSIQRSILLMATILIIYFASANSAPPATAGEWTLTLTAGENTAYRNGEAFELAGKPYIQDHTFYVPLQEVTEALGGMYCEYGDTAKVEFFAYTAEYHAGKNNYAVNGEDIVADAPVRCFPADSSGMYYNAAAGHLSGMTGLYTFRWALPEWMLRIGMRPASIRCAMRRIKWLLYPRCRTTIA